MRVFPMDEDGFEYPVLAELGECSVVDFSDLAPFSIKKAGAESGKLEAPSKAEYLAVQRQINAQKDDLPHCRKRLTRATRDWISRQTIPASS
jgi:hypothetical protein